MMAFMYWTHRLAAWCGACLIALVLGNGSRITLNAQTQGETDPRVGASKATIPRLEKAIHENLLGFWMPRALDRKYGGYHIDFDIQGKPRKDPVKALVTQARTVWLFARLAREGYGDRQQLLDAADHGYRFLMQHLWDAKHGGFYWEVDPTGKVTRTGKHLYGQSFGLYALSEYALASGRKDVLAAADRLFELLEQKAHDPEYGGYRESFLADWSPAPADRPAEMGDPRLKLMNTHLHLLESVSMYLRASQSPLGRKRLTELLAIQSNAVIRKDVGAGTDKYERDWTPLLEGNYGRASYGHDLENIWLLVDACDALGISPYPFLDLFKQLFAYSMKYGWDEQQGGFYDTGLLGQPADRRDKIWWVQSEAMVGALYMYRLTRDASYLDVYRRTWEFVDGRMIDWKGGEWYATITPQGEVRGDKANRWKAGYHNGRALIECLAILKALA
jgi:cellobiose epimerase